MFDEHGPLDGIIHAAAYTAVDKAEEEEDLAHRVNAVATGELAQACAAVFIPLVVVSTDFVFDGDRTRALPRGPTRPRRWAPTGAPSSRASRSRASPGPMDTRVVRTQWLYGPRGNHFPGTIVRLARERGEAVGSSTTRSALRPRRCELAPALWDVLRAAQRRADRGRLPRRLRGPVPRGSASRWRHPRALPASRPASSSTPCTTAEFPRPAPRPAYSVLDCSRLAALRGTSPRASGSDALDAFLDGPSPNRERRRRPHDRPAPSSSPAAPASSAATSSTCWCEQRPDWHVVNLDALTYAGNLENLTEVEGHPGTPSCTATSPSRGRT